MLSSAISRFNHYESGQIWVFPHLFSLY